jgi:hypothetical protein
VLRPDERSELRLGKPVNQKWNSQTLDLAQHFEQYLKSGSGHAFSKRHVGL